MSLIKVEAYKCEYCGRLFDTNRNYHDIECLYDPKARNCLTCKFNGERVVGKDIQQISYCPRCNELFKYPHQKYCPDYIKDNVIFEKDEVSE